LAVRIEIETEIGVLDVAIPPARAEGVVLAVLEHALHARRAVETDAQRAALPRGGDRHRSVPRIAIDAGIGVQWQRRAALRMRLRLARLQRLQGLRVDFIERLLVTRD